jgi:hypothetical protein
VRSQAFSLNMHDQPHKESHEEARSSQRYRRYRHHRRPHRVQEQHISRRQHRSGCIKLGTRRNVSAGSGIYKRSCNDDCTAASC